MNYNTYLLGTSNSVKANGYTSIIGSSRKLNLVGACKVGDVPATFFCSAIDTISQVNKHSKIDVIIIDTMINDVLMSLATILDEQTLYCGYEALRDGLASVAPKAKLLFLNFMPPQVVSSPTLTMVNDLREKIFPDSISVNIHNDETCEYFIPPDLLHYRLEYNRAVVDQIEAKLPCILTSKALGEMVHAPKEVKNIHFARELLFIDPSDVGFFGSSLSAVSGAKLKEGHCYLIEFDRKVQLLGLSFVASIDKNSSICIEIDGHKIAYSSCASYPKPLIRFIPFCQNALSSNVSSLKIRYLKNIAIPDSYEQKKLPNQGELKIDSSSTDGVLIDTLFYSSSECEISYSVSVETKSVEKRIRKNVYFDNFWPGFNYKNDPIFGKFLEENYDFDVVDDRAHADIVFASWYSPDKPTHIYHSEIRSSFKGIFVYYTAEHDGAGLRKDLQVDFDIYDFVISHYRIASHNHIWMPNYLRKHGLNIFSKVNDLYKQNIKREKQKNIQFCYSNPSCERRNKDLKLLQSMIHVDCGGKLYNNTDSLLPRDSKAYISALAQYKFIMAYENSSFPGYTTEKLVEAFMAGSVPIYWGDPLVSDIWNDKAMLNVNDCDAETLFTNIADDPDKVFSYIRASGELPMNNAIEFESSLLDYYQKQFALIFNEFD